MASDTTNTLVPRERGDKSNDPAIGEAIQNYVRRKWRHREKWTHDQAQETQLDRNLTERIDLLGIDDKLLLETAADRVIGKIEDLERRTAEEDFGRG